MLTSEERSQLLVQFNNTKADYPKDKIIIDLFEEQVEKTPDNIAVAFADKQLSYRALNEWSNQLGNYLRRTYQIQPDDLIGIKLERSEWMIVAILGVLKSGGAYVPIDPEYPHDRIDYMLKDSSCKVLLDKKELEKFIASKDKYSRINQGSLTQPHNLVYCIYTSGSTGKPKGVLIENIE